jgi:sulfur carrier protein
MEITVNQQSHSVSQHCSLQQMLATVFLQQAIISKANWDTYELQPGDNITVIKATQGG